ncbi:unnamed protein product [Phyllotreta striolata]|uniref:N-acetylneuraminate lyase n=1 Tax=Phyllotreta striolata TaxID=444603 RepID=A0A9N9XQT0_PHYSR|nr:unnamed protein product [Phyllotreta striolata]
MDAFEIGSCFKSYNELMQKLSEYCEVTNTKFTTKDSRLITNEFATAKESFVYSELKLICVFGRSHKIKEHNRKRKMRTIKIPKTECPAYFRIKLINSGVALQIVAMNTKHNHPLEKIEDPDYSRLKRKKDGRTGIKKEIKSEDEDDVSSDDMEASEFIEVYIDPDEPEPKVKFTYRGLCVPVFTPFREDLSLKEELIANYAQYLFDNGIKGILVNSAVGEGMSMSVPERKLVLEEWINVAKPLKMHVMVQVGACPLPDVLDLAKHAESIGVDSLLCIPELYFKPATEEDLFDYLKIVGEAAPKTPLLYSHNPGMSGVNLNMARFLSHLASDIPTFCGLEYTSDVDDGVAVLEASNEKYAVFFGDDSLVNVAISVGFESTLLVTANIYPQQVTTLIKVAKESKTAEAKKLQKQLNANFTTITNFGYWIPSVKTAMNLISPIHFGICRPPLKNLSADDIKSIKVDLKL